MAKEINKLLVNRKTGIQDVFIVADYWMTSENGRYLYELGDYAIEFPMMKDTILKRLNTESNKTRVTFNNIRITRITNKIVKTGIEFRLKIMIKHNVNIISKISSKG